MSALGQVLAPGEFEYEDSLAVKNELKALCSDVALSNLCGVKSSASSLPEAAGSMQKIGITPIYASDDMARLSAPLQATPLMQTQSAVVMNYQSAQDDDLLACEQVQVKQGKGTAVLPLRIDEGVPAGCVYVPAGIDAVKHLADAYGEVSLEKVS